MTKAYVDSSVVVAIEFAEESGLLIEDALAEFEGLVSSTLLEAEVKSVFAREGRTLETSGLLGGVEWIVPSRSLRAEIDHALSAGWLRGADLWHMACALYSFKKPENLVFATLEKRQAQVAASLGFPVLPS